MIVLLEDNGTYLSSVNAPYDPLRAKATPYQTGVRAPMVVAGPMVRAPGRTATKMVSAVDLFELFGEIAGLDVRSLVPASHILDSQPLLPCLTNPGQSSFRRYNFTQLGSGVKPPSVQTWPSVFTVADQKSATTSSSTLNSFAPPTAANGLALALQSSTRRVATFVSNVYPNLIIQPSQTWAVRNDRYKLVKSHRARVRRGREPLRVLRPPAHAGQPCRPRRCAK